MTDGCATIRFDALSLRERNAATRRRALLDAVLDRLATQPLEQINVRECCAEVGVSEPTFFNYFGSKAGALVFYVQLWSIGARWRLERAGSARAGIEALFGGVAEVVRETRWLLPEIIAYQFRAAAPDRGGMKPPPPPPSLADRLLVFPDLEGVESVEPSGVNVLIRDALERASTSGEISPRADVELVERLLLSLFFGAAASNPDPDVVADTMARGLPAIWALCHPQENP